jgi:parvulin-like peptidyl-prolyl isomerase
MSNLLIGKYIDKELRPRLEEVAVTPDEVRVAYESNLVRYTRSAQVRFSMLKLELGPKSSEERRREVCKRLDEARQKVLANPSKGTGLVNKGFGAYSVDYSDDQLSRYRGGDIGWIDESHIPSHLPKNIMEAGMALALGQVSDVIMADDGAYLLIKTDRRDASVKPFADIEAGLRQHLIAQKRQMMESSFKEQAVRRLAPMIDEKSLSALVLPERQGSNDVNKVRLPALPSAGISGQNK